MVSFAEIREKERVAETANLGPGAFDGHLKPIGHGMPKVDFGRKYNWKPDNNPAVGAYDPESAEKHIKGRIPAAKINKDSGYKRPADAPIEPG